MPGENCGGRLHHCDEGANSGERSLKRCIEGVSREAVNANSPKMLLLGVLGRIRKQATEAARHQLCSKGSALPMASKDPGLTNTIELDEILKQTLKRKVGTQSISPLYWAIQSGNLHAAEAEEASGDVTAVRRSSKTYWSSGLTARDITTAMTRSSNGTRISSTACAARRS